MIRAKGRAIYDATRPQAVGECDRCGDVYNHVVLERQLKRVGSAVVDSGVLVCPDCLDPLDDQQLPMKPGVDGQAVDDPRPTERSS